MLLTLIFVEIYMVYASFIVFNIDYNVMMSENGVSEMNIKSARKYIDKHIDIYDLYMEHILPLSDELHPFTQRGGFILCFDHDDKVPSMSHWGEKNVLHCFGCQAHYTSSKLYVYAMKRWRGKKLSDEQAIKELSDMYNLDIVVDTSPLSVFDDCRQTMESAFRPRPHDEIRLSDLYERNAMILRSNISIEERKVLFSTMDLHAAIFYGKNK